MLDAEISFTTAGLGRSAGSGFFFHHVLTSAALAPTSERPIRFLPQARSPVESLALCWTPAAAHARNNFSRPTAGVGQHPEIAFPPCSVRGKADPGFHR